MNKTILIAGDSFKTVIQETAKEFEIMAEKIAASIDVQEKTLKNVSQDVKVAVEKTLLELTDQSKRSISDYEASWRSIITNQSHLLNQSVTKATTDFNNILKMNTEESNKALLLQTQNIDNALQVELTKSIELMGTQLTALSKRFVDDYGPLTKELAKLVRIASENNQGRG
jgi:hypothetical protein